MQWKWLLGKNQKEKGSPLGFSRYQSASMSGPSGSKSLTFTSASSPYWMQLSIWDKTYCMLCKSTKTRSQIMVKNLTISNRSFTTTTDWDRKEPALLPQIERHKADHAILIHLRNAMKSPYQISQRDWAVSFPRLTCTDYWAGLTITIKGIKSGWLQNTN